MFDVASTPDLLRLLVIPVFTWAAWHDIKTRRITDRVWPPLVVLAVVLLVWDAYTLAAIGGFSARLFTIQVVLSIGLVIPLAYLFYTLGAFGGADFKALAVLALLFPSYPTYVLDGLLLPLTVAAIGVFSLTILSNTVIVALAYPVWLCLRNTVRRRFEIVMFVGHPVQWDRIEWKYGRLLESPSGYTRHGLDLDALRMYLEWRNVSLADIRANPDYYRDPSSLPEQPGQVGDGSIVRTDGGAQSDPWGARAFVDDIGQWYGTTPEILRDGLDVLATRDHVWVSPGIPFIVPMFFGLLLALTYGDLLFGILQSFGLL